MKKVTVVIPNYNGIEYIDKCMSHLVKQDYRDFNVIVVDNGSTDLSREAALKYKDVMDVTVVELGENYGFSRGVNEGIARADSEYVSLLNSDAYAGKRFIGELVHKMDSDDNIFSAQALMLQYRNRELTDSAGDYFSAMGWGFARGRDKKASDYKKDREVFSCCAGAAIYRKSVFGEIGMFDEAFFAYLEDMDMGYRARLAGYINVFVPSAKVLHVGSGFSGSRHNAFKVSLSARNSFLVMYKNFAPWQWLVNMPFIMAGVCIKTAYFARKKLAGAYFKGVFGFFSQKKNVTKTKAADSTVYRKIQKELLSNCFLRLENL